MQLDLFNMSASLVREETRRCNRCKENVSVDLFSLHRMSKSGLQGMCQPCNRKYQQDIQYLRKIAPSKPSHCECCGVESKNLHLDHDRYQVAFRGWVCVSCNTGIGALGDTIEGLNTGIAYLKRYYDEQH